MKRISINPRYRKPLIAVALCLGAVLAVLCYTSLQPAPIEVNRDGEHETLQGTDDEISGTEIRVHVDGAVQNPGLYTISGNDVRIADAIEKAGGLKSDADTSEINFAEKIEDGQKVYIPSKSEAEKGDHVSVAASDSNTTSSKSTSKNAKETSSQGAQSSKATASSKDSSASGSSKQGLVNINTASAAELEALPGVGASTAQAIIADRQSQGRFSSKQDLMRVKGIGQKKFAKLEALICV